MALPNEINGQNDTDQSTLMPPPTTGQNGQPLASASMVMPTTLPTEPDQLQELQELVQDRYDAIEYRVGCEKDGLKWVCSTMYRF